MSERYFDDFSVGMIVTTASVVLSEREIVEFGRAYDPQPFHTSVDAAKTTSVGALIASGWQTASIAMRLLVEAGYFGGRGALGAGVDELRWLRPVYPGDTLTGSGEVLALRDSSSQRRGYVKSRFRLWNQHGDDVLSMIATNLFPRR